jgi:1,4-dihydroxy-2-naphthoate octaprenyltransferase
METAAQSPQKSIITCDLEGRIETFSKGAEQVFGYPAAEVIGKKRVSLFSPGLTVLEHVPRWLASSVRDGAHETETVFVRKDGTRFPAKIKITPTFRAGKQIGYCGITQPLPAEKLETAAPKISLSTRIFAALVVTRAPFLSATIIPVLLATAYLSWKRETVDLVLFALTMLGACALHVAANTFNDLFDWQSGADEGNNDYFLPFSGGSRSIELGLISEQGLARLAWASLGVASLCGALLAWRQGPVLLTYGLFGAFAAYFYTAPPLRLVARRGLGELLVGLCFGPLMTAGTFTALSGRIDPTAFLIGLPVGLLTTAILWINEFPDAESDARVGKNHLVVTLGKGAARFGYLALVVGAFAILAALMGTGLLPAKAALAALTLPVALFATITLFKHYQARDLIRGNGATIALQGLFGLLMAIGLWLA